MTGVYVNGGNTILRAAPASIVDALAPGHYSTNISLRGGLGHARLSLPKGASAVPNAGVSGKSFTVSLNKVISCTGSVTSAAITGSFTVDPSVAVSFDVGFLRINSASVVASVTQDASLRASVAAAASCRADVLLATVVLPVFWIGPVPITASIGVRLDATAGVQGSATLSGREHAQGALGMTYSAVAGLKPVDSGSLAWNFDPPSISGSGKLEAGLTASVGVQIAGIIGPQLNARGYLGVSANPFQMPSWRLYDGVSVTGSLNLLGFNLGSLTIWRQEWTLASGAGSAARAGLIGEWNRWYTGIDHLALTGTPPANAVLEYTLGDLLSTPAAGAVPLYSCTVGSDEFTSPQSTCEGQHVNGLLGYIYTAPPAGVPSQGVYRCTVNANGEHFDSNQSNCEGQHAESLLGYTLAYG